MSTFTRLYFPDRGPSIAETDDHEAFDAPGEDFVSAETAPLDDADVAWAGDATGSGFSRSPPVLAEHEWWLPPRPRPVREDR